MSLDATTAPLLPRLAAAELDAARRITYRLTQSFRYDYDEPVTALRHRLVIVPPEQHGDVHLRHHVLSVRGAVAARRVERDPAGNTVVHVEADRVAEHIEFSLLAVLERVAAPGAVEATPVGPRALDDPGLLAPTILTAPDDALRAWAERLRDGDGPASPAGPSSAGPSPAGPSTGAEPALTTAARVCAAVHDALTYQHGTTTERTTAARALAGGQGVCQDFAHIMIALCRLLGIRARYVSGHLLGQGGTHAWVEVVLPAGPDADGAPGAAHAFDPCNGRRAGRGHLTVATGCDYADVAPTAGTYEGAPTGRLTSSRSVGVVDLA